MSTPALPPNAHIVFVITNIAQGGGAQKVCAATMHTLTAAGYTTCLVTFYKTAADLEVPGEHIAVHEATVVGLIGKLRRLRQRVTTVIQVARQREAIAIISFLEGANYTALAAALFLGRRHLTIVSVRNDPYSFPWWRRLLIRFWYRRATQVVAVTAGIAQSLQQDFGLTNVTTIYNPVTITATGALSPRAATFVAEHTPLLVTVGSMSPQKGQWYLLDALRTLRETHPQAGLMIVGDGVLRTQLTDMLEPAGLTDAVYLAGWQEQVYPFLAAGDVFVLSSLWEGLPNVLLEAQAAGCRIVTTDVPTGPREIIAPELDRDESIVYPAVVSGGVLAAPPSASDTVVAYDDTFGVTLATAIQAGLAQASPPPRIDDRFTTKTITKQWLTLLQ